MFCSPDRASRRPRFFGGRRPRPDAGASDQSSPPASRITGAARKQPPGCFVLPSRPSPGIASRFSSPFFPLTDREETIEGKMGDGRKTPPLERGEVVHVCTWVCAGVITSFRSLYLSLCTPSSCFGVFVAFYCIGCWVDAFLIDGRGTPRICSTYV